jgi:hypothetical protein
VNNRRVALLPLALLGLLAVLWVPATGVAGKSGLYPDMRTVVPTQLQSARRSSRKGHGPRARR